jgi:hypothetical protein
MRTLKLISDLLRDVVVLYTPAFARRAQPYSFAFIVHPRTERDILRKLPFLRSLPLWMRLAFQRYWFPGTVSPITGLTAKDGSIIPGYVISIPMAADLMLKETMVFYPKELEFWDNKPIQYSFNQHFYRDRRTELIPLDMF